MKLLVFTIGLFVSSAYANIQLDPNNRCSGDAILTEPFCNKAVMYCPNDYGLLKMRFYPKSYSTSTVVDLEAVSKDTIISNIIESSPSILNNCSIDELKFWDFEIGN